VGDFRRVIELLRAAALAGVAIALAAGAPAYGSGAAATFTVSGFSDGTGSCAAAPDANGNIACATLRAAVSRADLQGNQPTIFLQSGTYQLDAASGGQLAMGAFTIQGTGPGGPDGTTIQQTDGKDRVIHVQAGPAKLVGLEVTGGHLAPAWSSGTTWGGGGILTEGTLVLQNVVVTGNQVVAPAGPATGDAGDGAEGGGVDFFAGTPAGSSITNSVITNNTALGGTGGPGGEPGGAAAGGGVAYDGTGTLQVNNATISQNSATGGAGGGGVSHGGTGGAGEGGGIFDSGAVTVKGTTLAANSATGGAGGPPSGSSGGAGEGGGLFNQGALDQVVNTTVLGNSAQGGGASSGGTAGSTQGGGLSNQGATLGIALQSDTVDGNQGSNLGVSAPHTLTIHDTIVAGGSPTNCNLTSSASSESNDLEDDAGDQCGFTAANQDLVGVNPQLPSALADNGGPTQTLAPATTSPVLGAGGQCLDPTSSPPGQPLATDQRGLPRPSPCDVGAFQSQSPRNTARPVLSGVTTRGHLMNCTPGTWTGDGPFTFTYLWLRDGVTIVGATAGTYLLRAVDAGHTIACRVTATHYGATSATSPLASVTPNPEAMLLRASVSATTVTLSLGCHGATGQRCSGAAELTVVETLRGRKVAAVGGRGKARGNRTVIVRRRTFAIGARSVARLRLTLNSVGLELLKNFAHLPVTLTVTQSLPTTPRTIASRRLTVPPSPRG
jgi:hypothetical protein